MKSWWGGNGKRGGEKKEATGEINNRRGIREEGQGGRQGHRERQGEGDRHRELQLCNGDAPDLVQHAVTGRAHWPVESVYSHLHVVRRAWAHSLRLSVV